MSDRLEEIRERMGRKNDVHCQCYGDAIVTHAMDNDTEWLMAEVDRLRAKNTELNRRCTKAEAFVGKTVDQLRAEPGFAGFGRALANWAAENERRTSDERAARAWDKGYNKGREDGESWHVRVSGRLPHKQSPNPYRRKEDA